MKKMMAIIVSIIVISALLPYKAYAECEDTSSAVKVTVRQEGGKPVYIFTVTSFINEPISRIKIWSEQEILESELVPREVKSPLWWKLTYSIAGKSKRAYVWESYIGEYDVVSGMTQSGFTLVMPVLLDFRKFRFVVYINKDYDLFPYPNCAAGGPVTVEK